MDRATLYARGLPLPGTAPAVIRANRSGLRPLARMKRKKQKEGEALKEHLSQGNWTLWKIPVLEGSLRFGPELGHRRVGIALLGAVEHRDFRKMNFGDTNLVIAVLGLLLFQGRSKQGKIPPRY